MGVLALAHSLSHLTPKEPAALKGFALNPGSFRVGVLALPHSFSYLTWAGGPLLLVASCLTSLYTSYLLAALHQTEGGTRYNTYPELGRGCLGVGLASGTWACCGLSGFGLQAVGSTQHDACPGLGRSCLGRSCLGVGP